MEFNYAVLIVCPILYLMSLISVCGLKEVKSNIDQQSMEVEQGMNRRDPFWYALSLQLRVLWRFSLADSAYNMAYLGSYVSEMGYLLSFVFINAWTSQFFVD